MNYQKKNEAQKMTKQPNKEIKNAKNDTNNLPAEVPQGMAQMPQLTEKERKEIEEKINEVKKKVEKFSNEAREKFKDYILGVSVLPPEKKGQKEIKTIVLVNDADSKKMSKEELREKITTILNEIGKKEGVTPKVILSTELWQSCYDSNYEMLQTIAISSPIYDTGDDIA